MGRAESCTRIVVFTSSVGPTTALRPTILRPITALWSEQPYRAEQQTLQSIEQKKFFFGWHLDVHFKGSNSVLSCHLL